MVLTMIVPILKNKIDYWKTIAKCIKNGYNTI